MTILKKHDNYFISAAVLILILIALITPAHVFSGQETDKTSLYALKVETTVVNGITTDSRFIMLPANDEFRMEGFEKIIATGSSPLSSKNPLQEAINDALSGITVEKGLKSVKSSQRMIDGNLTDITTMAHEGVIRYPYRIALAEKKQGQEMSVIVEAEFSPYSMPSRWGWLKLKKSVSNSLTDMVSVLRQIWD